MALRDQDGGAVHRADGDLFDGWRGAGVDPARPDIARVYDYWPGGHHNLVAGREPGEAMATHPLTSAEQALAPGGLAISALAGFLAHSTERGRRRRAVWRRSPLLAGRAGFPISGWLPRSRRITGKG